MINLTPNTTRTINEEGLENPILALAVNVKQK